jgi:hypothetical protein
MIILFEVKIFMIQIQTRSKCKALDFPDDIIYQWEMYWFSNMTFIELPVVSQELDATIFLWSEKAWGSPFRIDVCFQDTNAAKPLNFLFCNT